MAFYVYNIQNCTTGGQIQAYTDELGSSNLAPGQTVVKIGNICYSVVSYEGFQQNTPIGALDMTPFTDASLLFPDCITCTNPTIFVNPTINTYYKYFVRPCGNVGGAQILATSQNVANLNAYVGGAVKINGTCYEVLSSEGTQTTPGDLDTTNGLLFNSCGDCNLPPPPPPPSGGSSGSSNNVYIYRIRRCGATSSAAIVDAYRQTTDLFPGYAVKSVDGLCFEVIDTAGYPIEVALNNIPAGAVDIRNTERVISGCANCTDTPTITTTQTHWEYDVQQCTDPTNSGRVWATQEFNLNQSIIIGNSCFKIYSKQQVNGAQPSQPYADITNVPKYSQCNCPLQQVQGGPGVSGTALSIGYNCVNGQCQQIIYDPNTGYEPQYTTAAQCAANCQLPGPSGFNCTVNGCVAATSGQGQYSSLTDCQANCQTPTTLPNGSWTYQLEKCFDVDTTITGYSQTEYQTNIVMSMSPGNCFRIITKQQITSPQQITGANIQGRPIIPNCNVCPVATTPIEDVCCFVGDTQVKMSDGTYKNICDVQIGDSVITSNGEISEVKNKITPIVGTRGLLSLNGGKSFATPDHVFKSIHNVWVTANFELSKTTFKAFDIILQEGGIIKQLEVGDYIFTENGLVLIESFEIINAGVYDETIVYDLTLDSNSDHTYFVDSFAAHNCNGDNSPVLTFCQQNPNHPQCDPCYLPDSWGGDCKPGCVLDCDKCPNDPRCNPGEPCDAIPEPIEGTLLTTRYVPTGLWTQVAVPEPEQFLFMIHECWRWKYCVCRSQPDPTTIEWQYRVCLCSEPIGDLPNPCPSSGTFIRYECKNTQDPNSPNKFEKWAIYANGSCGTYEQLIETNSVFCGFAPNPNCIQAGSLIRTYCINSDLYGEYHNGNCGKYIEKIQNNSKECGYIDPPPPPPPPDPIVVNEPAVSAIVYYPIDVKNTLKTLDISSFGAWTGNTPYLTTPSTASLTDSGSVSYILPVYDKSPDTSPTCSAELQYKLIYADYEGKGATDLGGLDNQTLTKAMYTQYAHILLPHGQEKFNFGSGDEDYVYIIDINRDRFKQALDPGNWQLTIASASFTLQTGSNSSLSEMMSATYGNNIITLVDEITKTEQRQGAVYLTSKNYNVVIGTIEDGIRTTYVTSSAASASISRGDVTHVVNSTTTTSNTAIVTGAEMIPFVFTNVTGSFTLEKTSQTYYQDLNQYSIGYTGYYTASFTGSAGPIAFTPNNISGSIRGTWNTVNINDPLGNGKLTIDTFFSTPVQYTTGSIIYTGFLKWGFGKNGKPPIWDCPDCEYFHVTASQGQQIVTSALTGSAYGYLGVDSWLNDALLDTSELLDIADSNGNEPTSTGSYTELPNGNLLFAIRSDAFGAVYPSAGIIVLSGRKLDEFGFATNRSIDRNGYNAYRLFHSMKLVLDRNLTDSSGDALGFYARGIDLKHASRYFITLKNSQLNYSNNPTYVTGSNGDISTPFLRQNKAYFTSVGLYNAERELLAIGKVSKPIMSSLSDESLFTVKITQ